MGQPNIAAENTIREYLHEKNAKILDVRGPDEFATKRVEGRDVVLIPVDELEQRIGEVEEKLGKNEPIVVHCAAGRRAQRAIDFLSKHGYTDLINGGGVDSVKTIAEKE